jgi:hypothetical protein
MEAVIAAYVSSWRRTRVSLPFEQDVDLETLFDEVKERDRKSFGYRYTIEPQPRPPIRIPEPMLGHRPPRTGESWESSKHSLHDEVEWVGLQRRLQRKG